MRRSLISAIEKLIFSFSYLIFNMHPFLYARGAFLALVEDIPLEPFFLLLYDFHQNFVSGWIERLEGIYTCFSSHIGTSMCNPRGLQTADGEREVAVVSYLGINISYDDWRA
jgi:hypothetical protein